MPIEKTQPKPYTYQNESQFPFLTKLAKFRQAKQRGINQRNWQNFLVKSGPLFTTWFNWAQPDYILVEIDEKDRKVKFYEKHPLILNTTYVAPGKIKGSLIFNEVRNFDEKLQIDLKKNFINGVLTPNLTYSWTKYKQTDTNIENELNKVVKLGIKFNFKKWLSNTTITNEKKIFLCVKNSCKFKYVPIQNYEAKIFLANRSNYHQIKDQKAIKADSIVKKSSDILGYSIATNFQKIGLQLSLEGGYDHFHRYNFNRIMFKFGNFKEYENYVVEMSVRAGTVLGKNLMENDLFERNKRTWVEERSNRFLNTRLNLLFKSFNPVFGVFQLVPLFYLQGCVSKNSKQFRTKFQLDYGIGVRFLNLGITFDTSLLRVGKNLDNINPSFRIIF